MCLSSAVSHRERDMQWGVRFDAKADAEEDASDRWQISGLIELFWCKRTNMDVHPHDFVMVIKTFFERNRNDYLSSNDWD